MKIIHTADVHLDAKCVRHFPPKQAKERRDELLLTFLALIKTAAEQGVEAIIIAGDLFDGVKVSATARDAVLSAFKNNSEITFYYLCGNHDALNPAELFGEIPANVKLFGNGFTSHELNGRDGEKAVITGAEAVGTDAAVLASSLILDHTKCNIVVLHGQETAGSGAGEKEVIPIKSYRNRGIDYLALGHIHAPKAEKLDARGTYAYCGCLEGRGFDECGVHGYRLLNVHNGQISEEFVPFARRTMWELSVPVTGLSDSEEIIRKAREAGAEQGIKHEDMVKLVLCGEKDVDAETDTEYIGKTLSEDWHFVKVTDRTTVYTDYTKYRLDPTLRGEYVRSIEEAVSKGELTEEEAGKMIRLGVRILSGEEQLS